MRNKEKTYNEIVQTAYVMFSEKGFDQTSLSSIASEIGISKPAIYYYFKSKDELIKYLFDKIVQEIQSLTSVELETITTTNFKQNLYQLGEAAISHQEKDVHFNHLFNQYMLLASRDTYYSERLLKIQQDFLNTFYDLLTYAVKINAIKDENILIKSQLLALVFDNITNFILTDMKLDYKKIWIEAVDSVLSGVEHHEQ
ncbi:TetR/AcrR family transcriptional regulator [Alkalicoccobacillus plakortidis]|uniref:TetR/AcrR family transcriptional regulator n=1 Tax=Alkalicoccobacillus plakortidis TaxID=444060 RepID=A0ABT0XPI7_9BACI|nr:TetR/AcrR family transcriptional regulator [Alkalicoccobacillus plakortidis]MCM2677635.1 TetR/AcrR family transcriptional regulator [Alkalicoccobacillus plakortidis]